MWVKLESGMGVCVCVYESLILICLPGFRRKTWPFGIILSKERSNNF
jgi:hypothetical protein